MPSVDLNSDLGEGFGTYRCGDDDAMLAIVTSANVACGLHAGDPEVMARTFAIARESAASRSAPIPDSRISGALAAAACRSRTERSSGSSPIRSARRRRSRPMRAIALPM